jgi:hypothetical protein
MEDMTMTAKLIVTTSFPQSDPGTTRFFLDISAAAAQANRAIIRETSLLDAANPTYIVDYDVFAEKLYLVRWPGMGEAPASVWYDLRVALASEMASLRDSLEVA